MKLSTLGVPVSAPGGALRCVSGGARVLQGVALYFGTPRGSRCMVPEFGVPPLGFYAGELTAWVGEVQAGLRLVQHVAAATVAALLDDDGFIRGRALIETDSGEEVEYEFTVQPA